MEFLAKQNIAQPIRYHSGIIPLVAPFSVLRRILTESLSHDHGLGTTELDACTVKHGDELN